MTEQSEAEKLAELTGGEQDRLADANDVFHGSGFDGFAEFIESTLAEKVEMGVRSPNTVTNYRQSFKHYSAWMEANHPERHPICPTTEQVRDYIRAKRDEWKDNTLRIRLTLLQSAFDYFATQSSYPDHPKGYNPVEAARQTVAVPYSPKKGQRNIPMDEYTERIRCIDHIRDRLWAALQAKYGLRVGEVCNIELPEVSLALSHIEEDYPTLGTHPELEGHTDCIYIPARFERDGNKSKVPRILPLDDEMKAEIGRYLLMRPQVEEPYLILSDMGSQSYPEAINRVWDEAFPDEDYPETERWDEITSHYGRHRFSTYWDKEQNIQSHYVQYLRGDVEPAPKKDDKTVARGELGTYVHTYYNDIAPIFRARTFKIGL